MCMLHTKSLQSYLTLFNPMDTSVQGYSRQEHLGSCLAVGCHAFLQGIFLTQGLNPCLLWLFHCMQILYC